MIETEIKMFRGTYCMYWRDKGRSMRRSLGTADLAEAKLRKKQVEEMAVKETVGTHTFRQLWDIYQKSLGDRPAAKAMGFESKAVLGHFGDLMPHEINPDVCKAYIANRRKLGRKDGSILTEVNRVSVTLGHAVKEKLLDQKPKLSFPPQPEPRDVYLPREDANRFIAELKSAHQKLFVILALTTGARSEALLQLTWDRVNLDTRRIDLNVKADRKLKGRAVVPINDTAHTALVEAKETAGNCPYVVQYKGERIASIKRSLRVAARAIGQPGVGPHALRHSAARWQIEAGVPLGEVSQFLGHRSVAITEKVYARYSPDYLARAASALNF